MAHCIRLREFLTRLSHLPLVIGSVCPLCSLPAENGGLCEGCDQALQQQRQQGARCSCCALQLTAKGECVDCLARLPAFRKVYSAYDLLDPADLLIHQYKIGRRLALVRVLGAAMEHQIRQHSTTRPADWWVISVPSRSQALKERGFNPAGELARELAKRLGCTYKAGQVYWAGADTELAQKQRGREARLNARYDGWACSPIRPGTPVLVVDDVLTTGSTLHHAAQLCLAAGAAFVEVAVAARTPWLASFSSAV